MGTAFGSFNRSRLGAFIQSRVDPSARGFGGESSIDGAVFLNFLSTPRFNAMQFLTDDVTDTLELRNGQPFPDGAPVRIFHTGTPPSPLQEGVTYFVVNGNDSTIQLSETLGGSAIDITDTGSANTFEANFIGSDFTPPGNLAVEATPAGFGTRKRDLVFDESDFSWSALDSELTTISVWESLYFGSFFYVKAHFFDDLFVYDHSVPGFVSMPDPGINIVGSIVEYDGQMLIGGRNGIGSSAESIIRIWENGEFTDFSPAPPGRGIASLHVGSDGNLYAGTSHDSSGNLMFAKFDGTSWTASQGNISGGSGNEYAQSVVFFNGKVWGLEEAAIENLFVWDGVDNSEVTFAMNDVGATTNSSAGGPQDGQATKLLIHNEKLYCAGTFSEWRIRESGINTDIPGLGFIVEITGDLSIDDLDGGVNSDIGGSISPSGDPAVLYSYGDSMIVAGGTFFKTGAGAKPGAMGIYTWDGESWGLFDDCCGNSNGIGGFAHIPVQASALNSPTPQIAITAPPNSSEFEENENITFEASASDDLDGDLSADIEWSSDLDGSLGTGAQIMVNTLSVGTHEITASITNAFEIEATDQIQVEVTAA